MAELTIRSCMNLYERAHPSPHYVVRFQEIQRIELQYPLVDMLLKLNEMLHLCDRSHRFQLIGSHLLTA